MYWLLIICKRIYQYSREDTEKIDTDFCYIIQTSTMHLCKDWVSEETELEFYLNIAKEEELLPSGLSSKPQVCGF